MADAMEQQLGRNGKFRAAALVLADDAVSLAGKLKKCIVTGDHERAEGLAAGLQRAARDAKWLMQRQPRS